MVDRALIEVRGWRPKSPNRFRPGHWAVAHKLRKEALESACYAITKAHPGVVIVDPPLRVTYTLIHHGPALDPMDNLAFSFKPIGDALERLGWIPDDSGRTIHEANVRQLIVKRKEPIGFDVLLETME